MDNNTKVYDQKPDDFASSAEVAAVYITVNGKILLLQLGDSKKEKGSWGVPAGKLEAHEQPLDAACRELLEETGISISKEHMHSLGCLYIRKPELDYVYHLFGTQVMTVPSVTLSEEHMAYTWVTRREAEILPLMNGAYHALKTYDQIMMESLSETNGISFLTDRDRLIYSVGISTAGKAEIKMAELCKDRLVIATTIDKEGAKHAEESIKTAGLSGQITVKVEDVSKPLSYPDEHFDYIYARLVLHYLPKNSLIAALNELYRILKPYGRLFVVVRSSECPEASDKAAKYDEQTCMTTYSSDGKSYSRYFHLKDSITHYLTEAGFAIKHVDAYQERLCVDFKRTQLASQIDSLIEVLAEK